MRYVGVDDVKDDQHESSLFRKSVCVCFFLLDILVAEANFNVKAIDIWLKTCDETFRKRGKKEKIKKNKNP